MNEYFNQAKFQADFEKTLSEIEKNFAEIRKAQEEIIKIRVETRWYPLIAGAAIFAAASAFTKLFL